MTNNNDHIDLSDDNLLPTLLEDRAHLKALLESAERRLKEINTIIKTKLDGARSASLPGWTIDVVVQSRREYIVRAQDVTMLFIKRVSED